MDDVGLQLFGAFEVLRGGGSLFFLLFALVEGFKHAVAGALAIDGHSLAAHLPGLEVEVGHGLLGDIVGQVDGHGDGVVHPFLHGTLELDFLEVVGVGGRSLVVG